MISKMPHAISTCPQNGIRNYTNTQKGGPAAGSNFDYSGPFTETVLLGNLAIRSGRQLDWDAENLRVTNFDPANQYVTKQYRNGWDL